jgi:hypothetical protein
MRDFLEDLGVENVLIGAIVVVLFGLLVWGGVVSDQNWNAFAKTHHCVVVAETEGYYNGSLWIAGTKTYRCDDGIERTR